MSEPKTPGSALAAGDRLGKYEILRLLALGGMGEIYLARARGIEGFAKLVALKRMLPHLGEDRHAVDQFLSEARLSAALHHPNIVHVYDIGRDGQSYFFAMEHVHGKDLRSVLAAAKQKGRGLSIANALVVVRGVAAGLHYAHESRDAEGKPLFAVHRDVSPGNVMLSYDGAVKILDFGIAKAAVRKSRTLPGAVRGTAAYMSPEQYRGEETDRRSDVFSLGVLLFELTTGTRLFRGASEQAIAEQVVSEDAPLPSSRLPGYPPELERIVVRALRRERGERFATAQALELEIEEFARREQVALSPVGLSQFLRDLFDVAADAHPGAEDGARASTPTDAPNAAAPNAAAPDRLFSQENNPERPATPLAATPPRGRPSPTFVVLALTAIGAAFGFTWTLAQTANLKKEEAQSAAAPPRVEPTPEPSPPVEPPPVEPPPVEAPPAATPNADPKSALPSTPIASERAVTSRPPPAVARRQPAPPATPPARRASPPPRAPSWDLDSPLPPEP